jgi:ligand-binding SRPBCC domain-containing protein
LQAAEAVDLKVQKDNTLLRDHIIVELPNGSRVTVEGDRATTIFEQLMTELFTNA